VRILRILTIALGVVALYGLRSIVRSIELTLRWPITYVHGEPQPPKRAVSASTILDVEPGSSCNRSHGYVPALRVVED
jgi:hypothetical protein